ncbi:uncharacterized protein LOC110892954 [Helianthus annuus]|uniref:uncharacterized protein LOC110892954 n=1 Tax=Helianthus annuus TaxID=4232 RepID=UPI000B8F9D85|nr:uncharacterized protein LOC110892954 [Helianthus annuus]
MALARVWSNNSTCPIVGNNQKSDGFWKEVCNKFHALMQKEPYRGVNSMGSKHREMNRKISVFCGHYNNAYSNRLSGASDESVSATAMAKYQTKEGSAFTYEGAWEIFKICAKWAPVPNEVARAKMSKTSGDGDSEIATPNWWRQNKKGSGSKKKEASTKNESPGESEVDKLISKLPELKEIQAGRLKSKEKEMQEVTDREDFKLMVTSIDSLPEKDKEVLQKMKARIAQKWGL